MVKKRKKNQWAVYLHSYIEIENKFEKMKKKEQQFLYNENLLRQENDIYKNEMQRKIEYDRVLMEQIKNCEIQYQRHMETEINNRDKTIEYLQRVVSEQSVSIGEHKNTNLNNQSKLDYYKKNFFTTKEKS